MGICGNLNIIPKECKKNFSEDIDYFKENNIVKLTLRLLNVKKKISCQIKLNIFTDKTKSEYKTNGIIDNGILDKEKEIMKFQKPFVMVFFLKKNNLLNLK